MIKMSKERIMPVIFVGHGAPTNAIGENMYIPEWKKVGEYLGKPNVIIAVSAHWYGEKLYVRTAKRNKQIHDMYGFPDELYQVKYEPKGSPRHAEKVLELLDIAEENNDWGIDHGVWSVLSNMYPEADVPVVMVSVNGNLTPVEQFEIGRKLEPLRHEGALVLGSGNIVHNLGMVDWRMNGGYKWAYAFDNDVKKAVLNGDFERIVNFRNIKFNEIAIPAPDHFYPFLNVLGAASKEDNVKIFNDVCELGSISMTSYIFEDI